MRGALLGVPIARFIIFKALHWRPYFGELPCSLLPASGTLGPQKRSASLQQGGRKSCQLASLPSMAFRKTGLLLRNLN